MEILNFDENLKLKCTKEQLSAINSLFTLFGKDNVKCVGWDDSDDEFIFGYFSFSIAHQKPVYLAVEYPHFQASNEISNTKIGIDVAEDGQIYFSVFVEIDDVKGLVEDE